MGDLRFGVSLVLVKILLTALFTDSANSTPIFLRLFERDGSFSDVNAQNASQFVPKLNISEKVTIFIPGWGENVTSEDVQIITSAYLQSTNENILALDYRDIAGLLYPISAEDVTEVGNVLAEGLNGMIKAGVSPKQLHVIGHSLGSHVAGAAGRNTVPKISQITGLDPAGPLFYFIDPHLSATDADFVDVIHTDAGGYGTLLNLGDVNFFPNYGHRVQPGCPCVAVILSHQDFCSHQKSNVYYAESVRNPDAFIGVECPNGLNYALGQCNSNGRIPMGYAVPTNASGTYYLTTPGYGA